jgi:hypothetical protein
MNPVLMPKGDRFSSVLEGIQEDVIRSKVSREK